MEDYNYIISDEEYIILDGYEATIPNKKNLSSTNELYLYNKILFY